MTQERSMVGIFRSVSRTFYHEICFKFSRCDLATRRLRKRGVTVICTHARTHVPLGVATASDSVYYKWKKGGCIPVSIIELTYLIHPRVS